MSVKKGKTFRITAFAPPNNPLQAKFKRANKKPSLFSKIKAFIKALGVENESEEGKDFYGTE